MLLLIKWWSAAASPSLLSLLWEEYSEVCSRIHRVTVKYVLVLVQFWERLGNLHRYSCIGSKVATTDEQNLYRSWKGGGGGPSNVFKKIEWIPPPETVLRNHHGNNIHYFKFSSSDIKIKIYRPIN